MNAPARPDIFPWPWDDSLVVDGEAYPANWLDPPEPLADRFSRTAVIRGVPPRFRDDLLRAAQGSQAPHAWQVGGALPPEEVTEDVLAKARILYDRDLSVYGSRMLTFLAEAPSGDLALLGCAAARMRPSHEYESEGWVVLSRLLAVPEMRGIGLGRHFTLHFFGSSQTLFDRPALGCILPTDAEQTRRLCRRAVESGALDMVRTGHKRWHLLDSWFEVEVYVAFYPGMREWLLESAREVRPRLEGPLGRVVDVAMESWQRGFSAEEGVRIGALFAEHEAALVAAAEHEPALKLVYDFLASMRAMGTLDGIGT